MFAHNVDILSMGDNTGLTITRTAFSTVAGVVQMLKSVDGSTVRIIGIHNNPCTLAGLQSYK